ncbi:2-dehydropantoate 2-reductase [Metabacillus iocasae]|uniref:2-dehydropantoate 2-reductase n=1 Tax=Priestia iocasae TaxID=2291674 RepID=A0ABS2QRC3_9BACI|nr:2-dehydropantoate 2-reductase [Metabacillus iocasae]MBM7701763.1 2-dehydropantoate 2-reductase [Metabacillus iocasae]
MKQIAIIGGGAVGLLYSAYLGKHFNVTLYTRTAEQAEQIKEKGITLIKGEYKQQVAIYAQKLEKKIKAVDIIIVAVKQYHLSHILPYLKEVPQHTPILFIQNGMKHLSIIESLINETLLLGVVEHGALKVDASTVEHTGVGLTRIGLYKGSFSQAEFVLHMDENSSFLFKKELDWKEILVRKLVINAIINPLTAIYRVKNGELTTNPAFLNNMNQLFSEISAVLHLNEEKVYWEAVVDVCNKTANNYSSMLKDVLNGKSTEIDAILGYILEEATRRQVNVPLTYFLYHSIKGLENKERE